jgi:hypothetical protein
VLAFMVFTPVSGYTNLPNKVLDTELMLVVNIVPDASALDNLN